MHNVISVISFYDNGKLKLILHRHKIKSSTQIYVLLFVIHNFCDKHLLYQFFVRLLLLAYFSFQNFGT